MPQTNAKLTPQAITSMLDEGRIYEAICALNAHDHSPRMLDSLREAEIVYTQLLRFFASGAPDDSRARQLDEIREKLYIITDSLKRRELIESSQSRYWSTARIRRLPSSPSLLALLDECSRMAEQLALLEAAETYDLELRTRFDASLSRLFDALWVNHTLSRREYDAINNILAKARAEEEAWHTMAIQLLSALLLSALEYFDRGKLELLLLCYGAGHDTMISARALVGAALITICHGERAIPGMTIDQLSALCHMRQKYDAEMRTLITAILRTRDTDRVNRKMTNEIIPDLLKLKPEIEKRIRSIDPEDFNEEAPEWMEMIEKSGAADKLREFTEMQMQGADVFMGAFSGMKNFPFFRSPANWFLPFSTTHSAVHRALQGVPPALPEMMLSVPLFCSSDKFSLAFSLGRMPRAQADMITAQMQTQMEAMDEEKRASLKQMLASSLEAEINVYLKDLFRFFRLSEFREGLRDPFSIPFTLPAAPLFAPLAEDNETTRLIADFYFKNSYWKEAAPLYARLADTLEADSADAQKHGYCLEKMKDMKGALAAYQHAELIDEPSGWLLKRSAATLRATGKCREAATYYSRALEKEPENMRLEMLRGHSLLEAGDAKEALKCYYKVDYLDLEGSGRAMRPIAWCEFLTGAYEKSLARYAKITATPDASPSDMLNHGHVLLASRDVQGACGAYRKALEKTDPTWLRAQLKADADTLTAAGVSPLDLSLVADAVLAVS